MTLRLRAFLMALALLVVAMIPLAVARPQQALASHAPQVSTPTPRHRLYFPQMSRDYIPRPTATPTRTPVVTPTATPIPNATLFASSYYVQADSASFDTTEYTRLYNAGCALGAQDVAQAGRQDNLMILAFGKPWQKDADYGVSVYQSAFGVGRPFLTMAQVRDAAKFVINGYWNCSDGQSLLTLAVGVNTFDCYGAGGCTATATPPVSSYTDDAYGHGVFWARMVNDLAVWNAQQGFGNRVTISAGLDSELAWNPPIVAREWMRGFIYGNENPVTKTQRWRVFNFGACEGCPTADNIPLQTLDTWVGLNGWKLEDVYHMSWGAAPAWAVPEIYLTNGLHARQWRNVSRLGALKLGSKIDFPGILTQSQACQQRGCNDGTNQTPLAARDQFLSALNNDPYTRQDALRWLTDIRWIVN